MDHLFARGSRAAVLGNQLVTTRGRPANYSDGERASLRWAVAGRAARESLKFQPVPVICFGRAPLAPRPRHGNWTRRGDKNSARENVTRRPGSQRNRFRPVGRLRSPAHLFPIRNGSARLGRLPNKCKHEQPV